MLHDSLITIFFRLLNAAVLIGIGFYLFKKYIKVQTDEKITQQEALINGLEEQGYFLEGKAHKLARTLHQQEKNVELMQHKIDEWGHAVAAQSRKIEYEQEIYATHRMQRALIKNNIINNRYSRAHIIPETIALLQHDLQEKFSNPSAGQAYTDALIHHVEKGM
jgi:hypothetical protein